MIKRHILICLLGVHLLSAQNSSNTVGVLSNKDASEGYNLVFPHNQSDVFLLNNCGEIVHEWRDEKDFVPGNMVYLLKDGSLLKCKKPENITSLTFGAGGAGGVFEWLTWDNELLWSGTFMNENVRAHHDIAPLPNGNFLAIIWERKNLDEVIANGGDTSIITVNELWPDFIIEINPLLDSIVWEWHAFDHLIQDFDDSKMNFGSVSEHPERIDINYDLEELGLRPDWMHANAIDYNPKLDHILLSVPHFGEMWVIDHSTTTKEARTSSGGQSNKGGDLLFRWGNPRTYKSGSKADQQSFFQHDTRWIQGEEISSSEMGSISFFNNRVDTNRSIVNVIKPLWDKESQSYHLSDGVFLPEEPSMTIVHPDRDIFSSGLSSAQKLDSENFLITVGSQGYSFEVTPNNNLVWEYKMPLDNGTPIPQGTILSSNRNFVFRLNRYPLSFPGFIDKELIPQGYIELDPNESFCDSILTDVFDVQQGMQFSISPNPTNDIILVSNTHSADISGDVELTLMLFSLNGILLDTKTMRMNGTPLSTSNIDENLVVAIITDEQGKVLYRSTILIF